MKSSSTPSAAYQTVTEAPAEAMWMVLVHGVSQDHRLFDRQVDAFKKTYRLILVDLPGHGRSSAVPGPYGLQEYALSINDALDHADVGLCHFWGTHLGAAAGLLLACQCSDRFQSLILEGPVFPGRPLPAVSDLLQQVSAITRDKGVAAAREFWWHEGGWFDVMRSRPAECRALEQRRLIDDFGGQPWLDTGLLSRPMPALDKALARLRLPVLIINGEHDLADFIDVAKALEAIIPHSNRTLIPEAGGFPLWEFPDRVNQVVRAFLNNE